MSNSKFSLDYLKFPIHYFLAFGNGERKKTIINSLRISIDVEFYGGYYDECHFRNSERMSLKISTRCEFYN